MINWFEPILSFGGLVKYVIEIGITHQQREQKNLDEDYIIIIINNGSFYMEWLMDIQCHPSHNGNLIMKPISWHWHMMAHVSPVCARVNTMFQKLHIFHGWEHLMRICVKSVCVWVFCLSLHLFLYTLTQSYMCIHQNGKNISFEPTFHYSLGFNTV